MGRASHKSENIMTAEGVLSAVLVTSGAVLVASGSVLVASSLVTSGAVLVADP